MVSKYPIGKQELRYIIFIIKEIFICYLYYPKKCITFFWLFKVIAKEFYILPLNQNLFLFLNLGYIYGNSINLNDQNFL